MRFEPESLHGANAGLHIARELMEKIKIEFNWITHGDLWTLGGVCAVQVCSIAIRFMINIIYNLWVPLQEMAGPPIPWRPGRIDGFAAQATPDGRLPDASQGSDHLRTIFYRMGYVFPQRSQIDES